MALASQQLSSLQLEVQQHLAVMRGGLQAGREHGMGAGDPLWPQEAHHGREGGVQGGTRGGATAGWWKQWRGLLLRCWMRGWGEGQGEGTGTGEQRSSQGRNLALTVSVGGVVVLTALAYAMVAGKDGWPAFMCAVVRQKHSMKSGTAVGPA